MEFNPQSDFWAITDQPETDAVPVVATSDLRKVFAILREHGGPPSNKQVAFGVGTFERVCGPGADIRAVWYRASMLLLLTGRVSLLTRWMHDGQLDDAVFRVSAKFPMKKLHVGGVHQDLPLDVEDLVEQIRRDSGT